MKKILGMLVVVLALSVVSTPAQTKLDIVASGASTCFGSIYPIRCSTPLTMSGPEEPYQLSFAIQGSGIQTLCFLDTYCHYVNVTSFTQHVPVGAMFPDTVTFTFQGNIEVAGNGYTDGYYDDVVVGTVTYNLTYTRHASGGGRGSRNSVWTANVTSVSGSLMYTD